MNDLIDAIINNKTIFIIVLSCVALIVVLLIVLLVISSKNKKQKKDGTPLVDKNVPNDVIEQTTTQNVEPTVSNIEQPIVNNIETPVVEEKEESVSSVENSVPLNESNFAYQEGSSDVESPIEEESIAHIDNNADSGESDTNNQAELNVGNVEQPVVEEKEEPVLETVNEAIPTVFSIPEEPVSLEENNDFESAQIEEQTTNTEDTNEPIQNKEENNIKLEETIDTPLPENSIPEVKIEPVEEKFETAQTEEQTTNTEDMDEPIQNKEENNVELEETIDTPLPENPIPEVKIEPVEEKFETAGINETEPIIEQAEDNSQEINNEEEIINNQDSVSPFEFPKVEEESFKPIEQIPITDSNTVNDIEIEDIFTEEIKTEEPIVEEEDFKTEQEKLLEELEKQKQQQAQNQINNQMFSALEDLKIK